VSEEKEGLMEKALRTYREHLEFRREVEKKETQKFAEEVKREFIRRFDTEPEKVTAVSPNECYLECNGLRFRVVMTRGDFRFYVLLKCEMCQRTIEEWVTSLLSLGEALAEPCICFECREAKLKSMMEAVGEKGEERR